MRSHCHPSAVSLLAVAACLLLAGVDATHSRGGIIEYRQNAQDSNKIDLIATLSWNPDTSAVPSGAIYGVNTNNAVSSSCGLSTSGWAISTANQVASGNVTGERYRTYRQTITITKPASTADCKYRFTICCRIHALTYGADSDMTLTTKYSSTVSSSFTTTAPPVVPISKASTPSGYGSAFIPVTSDAGLAYNCNLNQQAGITVPSEFKAVKVMGGCRIDWYNSVVGADRAIGAQAPMPLRVVTLDGLHWVDIDFIVQVVNAAAAPTVVISSPSSGVIASGSTVQFILGVTSTITFTGTAAAAASTLVSGSTGSLPPRSTLTPTSGGTTLATVLTYTPAAGDPLTGVITIVFTDNFGQLATASLLYNIDVVKPVVTPPANQLAEATGPTGATVSYSGQSATDDVSGSLPVTCNPASGTLFAIGNTPVTCSATDAAGNTGTATFTVSVRDTTKPVVTPPANQLAEATGPSGATVSYSGESATDAVAGSPAVTCTPSSGSTFAIGDTPVTCSASDAAGNTGTATFTVSVRDTTKPVVTPPTNQLAEATGPSGATVSYSGQSATDAVAGSPAVTCTPSSGSTFAIGDTPVTCSASDAAGNTGTATFTVSVRDTTKPVVTPPANQLAEATGPSGATVSYSGESATDAVAGSPAVTCTPSSGSTFAIGDTPVTCSASDAAGNTGTATFTVSVRDTTKPVVTPPTNQLAEATGPSGATVSYSGQSATDAVAGSPAVTCTPSSGSTFAIGDTPVTCSASDAAGNTGTATFTVSVRDTTKPVVTPPANQLAEATGPSGATVSYSGASATDAVAGSPAVTCTPSSGSTFAIGDTPVTCSASDAAGNTGTATFTVSVRDTTKPVVTPPANQAVDATGGLTYATVSYSGASATDAVAGSPPVTCLPSSGSSFAIGDTTVTCSATDAAGNTGTATFTVTVRPTGSCIFGGFQAPAPRDPATLDSVTATQTLPVKWSVGGGADFGLGLLASGSPYLVMIDCTTKVALANQAGVPTPTDMSSQLKKSTDGGVTTYQLNYPLQGKNLVRGACYSLNFVFNICPLSTRQWLFKVK